MKNILKTAALCMGLISLVACEKDEEKATLNADAKIEASLSTDNVVLTQGTASQTALTVSWETKNLNINLAPKYTVNFVRKDGKKEKSISVEKSPLAITGKELNDYLISDLEITAGTTTEVTVAVRLVLSDQRNFSSEHKLKVTPFLDEIKPSDWGIAGDGANGWDPDKGLDIKMWKGDDGALVAYATLKTGSIKFRKDNKWDLNYGGSNGKLVSGGTNIAVLAGTYKITFNEKALTYSIEKYSWGLIGNGAKGWGDNDDIAMTYEGSTNSWVVKNVTLVDGEIKFRLNHSWGTNFGADSTDNPATALSGNLKDSGNNIKVSAGTYNVSFSFDVKTKEGTYKIEKL
jgi:hypothetical protein